MRLEIIGGIYMEGAARSFAVFFSDQGEIHLIGIPEGLNFRFQSADFLRGQQARVVRHPAFRQGGQAEKAQGQQQNEKFLHHHSTPMLNNR